MDEFECIANALSPRNANITRELVQATFKDWEIIKLNRNGNMVGVILRKNAEVHIVIEPTYQNSICFIGQSRKILNETIAKYGYAETKVLTTHTTGHRLAKILGFTQTGIDQNMVRYIKEV
jgi:hypothetical protein